VQLGELQGEDGDAARSLHDDRVAGPHAPGFGDRLPGGQPGDRQGGCLRIRQMLRHADDPGFRQDDVFREHAVQRSAEAPGMPADRRIAVDPALGERAGDPVADAEPLNPGPELDDLSDTVGHRNDRKFEIRKVKSVDHPEIARIERDGPHPDERFARSRDGNGPIDEAQVVQPEALQFISFHVDHHSFQPG